MSLKPGAIEEAYAALGITREDMTRRILRFATTMRIGFAVAYGRVAVNDDTLRILDNMVLACDRDKQALKEMGRNGPITLYKLFHDAEIFVNLFPYNFDTPLRGDIINKDIMSLKTRDFGNFSMRISYVYW